MSRIRAYLRQAAVALSILSSALHAQEKAVPETVTPDSTLRVYVNLMQLPVLVLDEHRKPMPRLPDAKFTIHLDGLGTLPPRHVRLQGQDPMAVVLLIDHGGDDDALPAGLGRALPRFLESMGPDDRLTVLVEDGCHLRRVGTEFLHGNTPKLAESVGNALKQPRWADTKKRGETCDRPLTLWDGMKYAATRLATFNGRRILLPLSNGQPAESIQALLNLRAKLNGDSISAFPVVHETAAPPWSLPYGRRMIRDGDRMRQTTLLDPIVVENPVRALAAAAEISGGLLQTTTERALANTLVSVLSLARGRYILEFPRPDTIGAGHYAVSVSDGRPADFIRVAGISVPVAGPEERPAAVASDTAEASPAAVPPGAALQKIDSAPPVPEPPAPNTAQPAAAPVPVVVPSTVPAPPDPTDITGDLRTAGSSR